MTNRCSQELSKWEPLQEVRGWPFPKHISEVEDGSEPRELDPRDMSLVGQSKDGSVGQGRLID